MIRPFSYLLKALPIALVITTLGGCTVNQPAAVTAAQAPPKPAAPAPIPRAAISGTEHQVDFYYSVNADCTPAALPTVVIERPPVHGRVDVKQVAQYPLFEEKNQRYECNKKKTPSVTAYYTSVPGYHGTDNFSIKVLFDSGYFRTSEYVMTVE